MSDDGGTWQTRTATNSDVEAMASLLGLAIAEVLRTEPFSGWTCEASDDRGLGRTNYVFRQHGVDLVCDALGHVTTIFLHCSADRRFRPELVDLPFGWPRAQVRAALGSPARSGEASTDPLLGEYGPWDRFTLDEFDLHVHFIPSGQAIELLAFLRR
jgi:hypothetical protein